MTPDDRIFVLRVLRGLLSDKGITRGEVADAIDRLTVKGVEMTPWQSRLLLKMRAGDYPLRRAPKGTRDALAMLGLVTDSGELTPEGKVCAIVETPSKPRAAI